MDFTLALAHFCEVHGPTSVLCTQTLAASCSVCTPEHTASTNSFSPRFSGMETSKDAQQKVESLTASSLTGLTTGPADRCASCRINAPGTSISGQDALDLEDHSSKDPPPLRSVESVHVCNAIGLDEDLEDDSSYHGTFPHPGNSASQCHSHHLEYISSSNPIEAETFSSLRRAAIRTLSGEQLPRGQSSGPLWFGDPTAGYTIAYIFRLADLQARGRQRYYALLALTGPNEKRAFEACMLVWSLFEKVASCIVKMASDVTLRAIEREVLQENDPAIPFSVFLAGRNVEAEGFAGRGPANIRMNSIADLVDNKNFFYELHITFVGILQELGRRLGGMRIRGPEKEIPK